MTVIGLKKDVPLVAMTYEEAYRKLHEVSLPMTIQFDSPGGGGAARSPAAARFDSELQQTRPEPEFEPEARGGARGQAARGFGASSEDAEAWEPESLCVHWCKKKNGSVPAWVVNATEDNPGCIVAPGYPIILRCILA